MTEDEMMEAERRIKTAEDMATMKAQIVHLSQVIEIHNANMNAAVASQNAVLSVQSKQISELVKGQNETNLTLSQATGGWKVFIMIGTAGAALGAGILSVIQTIKGWGH